MVLEPFHQKILEAIRSNQLPEWTPIPLSVAEMITGNSRRTIKRKYPLVDLSEGRKGVRLKHLKPAEAK